MKISVSAVLFCVGMAVGGAVVDHLWELAHAQLWKEIGQANAAKEAEYEAEIIRLKMAKVHDGLPF